MKEVKMESLHLYLTTILMIFLPIPISIWKSLREMKRKPEKSELFRVRATGHSEHDNKG